MGIYLLAQMFHHVEIRRLLVIIIISLVAILAVFQCFLYPYSNTLSLSSANQASEVMVIQNVIGLNNSGFLITYASDRKLFVNDSKTKERDEGCEFTRGECLAFDQSPRMKYDEANGSNESKESETRSVIDIVLIGTDETSRKSIENLDPRPSDSFFTPNISSVPEKETRSNDVNTDVVRIMPVITKDNVAKRKTLRRSKSSTVQPTSISQMNSILFQSLRSPLSKRPRSSSQRDRELVNAKLEIENAPAVRNHPGLTASIFRNVSMFMRSYELMEHIFKVYIYKEGEKPIFHQPIMRGIYASEGWFMKLIERNKNFVVRDPKKAHLFYLPFSSQMLRIALSEQNNFHTQKDLENHLRNFVDSIGRKYHFWNRTGGSDHFLVACHDWASRLTRQYMKNCIRSLCNANVARGFKIGKDTSLPVTYIRSSENPTRDIGGKRPSERTTLAFFAGSLHGYLRPILLDYWENKEPDMKIFGPMLHDIEGKRIYMEHMKNSKYCICARGYEVHTPRVVEAIFYECIPVILSDNYVPPFFEVLNWESFSVFVQEKDIPNMRNILLSIPEEKYLEMHGRVKMVQKHFVWHKNPVRYDVFHMVLHSVWYNRVFQTQIK